MPCSVRTLVIASVVGCATLPLPAASQRTPITLDVRRTPEQVSRLRKALLAIPALGMRRDFGACEVAHRLAQEGVLLAEGEIHVPKAIMPLGADFNRGRSGASSSGRKTREPPS